MENKNWLKNFEQYNQNDDSICDLIKSGEKCDCSEIYNSCDCGGVGCGCDDCYSCNACETCLEKID